MPSMTRHVHQAFCTQSTEAKYTAHAVTADFAASGFATAFACLCPFTPLLAATATAPVDALRGSSRSLHAARYRTTSNSSSAQHRAPPQSALLARPALADNVACRYAPARATTHILVEL
eukprot:scaffold5826_cov291-Prasinococcus_capsulatus_cf.AAC.2